MDAYSSCPGGCGKKIKFCCGADVIADLEKIDRMLAGDQRRACFEHIAKMPAKFRDKPCAIAKKLFAELAADDLESFETTARAFFAANPDNPVALACAATLEMRAKRIGDGTAMLQRAVEVQPDSLGATSLALFVSAIGTTANALMTAGYIAAARAHFGLYEQWTVEDDHEAAEALLSIEQDMRVPMVWKDDPIVPPCPADAPFKDDYESAHKLADHGHWRKAREKFESLAAKHPNHLALWRAIAAVRTFLADNAAAVEAFRRAAALDVPAEDAVEFELHAQSLLIQNGAEQADDQSPNVDDVRVVLTVKDFDALLPRLLSDKRLVHAKADLSSLATEDRPAPRDLFRLLDRPALDPSSYEANAAATLRPEDIPVIVGEMLLFGRETDREPRIEMECLRTNSDAAIASLADVAGDALGDKAEEIAVGAAGPTQFALNWRWYLPAEFPADAEERLSRAEYRRRLLEVWPNNKVRGGHGLTMAEAARGSDPQLKRAVLANILDLEVNYRQVDNLEIFNELRVKLGLPPRTDVDPFRIDLDNISLLRLGRLPAELMPDDQLLMAFNLAASVKAPAVIRLGEAVVERTTIESERRAMVLLSLARSTVENARSIDYLRRGKELYVAAGKSPALWLLEELAFRLSRPTSAAEIERLLAEIMTHRSVPGVLSQLTRILAAFGVIDPQQMQYRQPQRESAFSVAGMELRAQPDAAPAETVGAGTATGEKKSGLWLPGMD